MTRRIFIAVLALAFGFFIHAVTVQDSSAGVLGNGSAMTDNLQLGTITKIGNRQLTIKTKFEKTAKTYTLHLLPKAYVMTADRGVFKKFTDLRKGDLIAAYGWYKNNKWNARRIDILDPKDYLIKRLAADAKAGFYYKHER